MKNIINKIPTDILIFATIILGLAPFVPEPHLWQKIKMLVNGELTRPLDIFDLLMHGTPAVLLLIKLSMKTESSDQIPK
ncbi:MAG: RND transporter [Gammaproteobacteria bacterium]|nr:RND transporter [Gammaproteobacteria bacterium]